MREDVTYEFADGPRTAERDGKGLYVRIVHPRRRASFGAGLRGWRCTVITQWGAIY